MGNNSIIKTTHVRHEARDEIFQAPSPFFGGGAWVRGYMMTSCEPRRSSAYSDDLRWRMVWQSEALGCSYSTIAQNLNVDKSTVCRTIQLFYSTGTVSKRDYPKESAGRKLSNPAQLFILHLVIKRPGIYLYKLQSELSDLLGIEVFQRYSVFYMRMVLPDRSFKSLQYREMSS